ncbi:hypothetical protein B1750_gp439 [Noumeavirus]|uniref:hypothetical protein n=1 Tax=Noumeavirus TaxID=1955558 RepID=UPI000982F12C|nr:hypothetical protein B1750_gp439 [Noumeavirus]AQM73420.1 hypothetical protein NMV_439 [Noumeavirus]
MKVTLQEARALGKKLGIDFSVVPIKLWRYGLEVETEHLRSLGCDLEKIAMVARDHLREFSGDYYIELWKMEQKLEKRFKGKKPRVLLPGTKLPPACRR